MPSCGAPRQCHQFPTNRARAVSRIVFLDLDKPAGGEGPSTSGADQHDSTRNARRPSFAVTNITLTAQLTADHQSHPANHAFSLNGDPNQRIQFTSAMVENKTVDSRRASFSLTHSHPFRLAKVTQGPTDRVWDQIYTYGVLC